MISFRGDGETPCPGPFLGTALAPHKVVREDGEQWVRGRVRELFRLPASDALKPLDKGRFSRANQLDMVRNTNPLWRPRNSRNCGSRTVLRGRRDPALLGREGCLIVLGILLKPGWRGNLSREGNDQEPGRFSAVRRNGRACDAHVAGRKSEPPHSTLSRVTPCTWGRWWSGG